MKIQSSVDWNKISIDLRHKAHLIEVMENRTQLLRMIDNIGSGITKLSKAEVLARRGNNYLSNELLEKINEEIELIEEYLLMAVLLG